MHLLAAAPGAIDDGSEAIDLGQTRGDIIVLTAADTEITALAMANRARIAEAPGAPPLRLANYLQLAHNMSVDLYIEEIVGNARLVICRLLGGRGYWPYGVDENRAELEAMLGWALRHGITVAPLEVDDLFAPETLTLTCAP